MARSGETSSPRKSPRPPQPRQFAATTNTNWLDESLRFMRGPDVRAMGRSRGDNDWAPIGKPTRPAMPRTAARAGGAGRGLHEFIERAAPERDGASIARSPTPLLDVFMMTCAATRLPTWNKRDDQSDTFILGATQLAWLKRELVASNATWKVIAADMRSG